MISKNNCVGSVLFFKQLIIWLGSHGTIIFLYRLLIKLCVGLFIGVYIYIFCIPFLIREFSLIFRSSATLLDWKEFKRQETKPNRFVNKEIDDICCCVWETIWKSFASTIKMSFEFSKGTGSASELKVTMLESNISQLVGLS